MPNKPINGREPEFSEEDMQREELGPRGVPGKKSPAKMTPQAEKNTPNDQDTATRNRRAYNRAARWGFGLASPDVQPVTGILVSTSCRFQFRHQLPAARGAGKAIHRENKLHEISSFLHGFLLSFDLAD
jgi:hypothetical protein